MIRDAKLDPGQDQPVRRGDRAGSPGRRHRRDPDPAPGQGPGAPRPRTRHRHHVHRRRPGPRRPAAPRALTHPPRHRPRHRVRGPRAGVSGNPPFAAPAFADPARPSGGVRDRTRWSENPMGSLGRPTGTPPRRGSSCVGAGVRQRRCRWGRPSAVRGVQVVIAQMTTTSRVMISADHDGCAGGPPVASQTDRAQPSAFAFSAANSASVIVPASNSALASAIWSAADFPATLWM